MKWPRTYLSESDLRPFIPYLNSHGYEVITPTNKYERIRAIQKDPAGEIIQSVFVNGAGTRQSWHPDIYEVYLEYCNEAR